MVECQLPKLDVAGSIPVSRSIFVQEDEKQMPIYEYECKKCGVQFEQLVSISAKQKPPCPECGSRNVKKLLSMFGMGGSKSSSGGGGSSCGSCTSSNCSTCH
jgi:putative FmdB family regulatory protein